MKEHNWFIKTIGETCDILSGYAFNSKLFSDDKTNIPIIRIRDISRGYTETYYKGEYKPEYIVENGDYLIGMDGEFNINKWEGNCALLNQRVCKISVKDKTILHPAFLLYFMPLPLKKIEDETPFVTVKHLSTKKIADIKIPIPSIIEQEKIIGELDGLSKIINNKKKQLEELDKLAHAIFYDMFGDPMTNERGWNINKLENEGTIVTGSTPSTNDSSNWDGDIDWITPAELGVQLYYGETKRKLTAKGAKGLTLMPSGTVILSTRAPIGKLAISTRPMCCNQGFKNIICGDRLNNIYLYYYLMLTMRKIELLGRGATFKEVSKNSIATYNILTPPLPIQQQFAEKIKAIEKQKALIKKSLEEVETLFNSRMDYYFN